MRIPTKLLYADSKLPLYGKEGDACLDLFVHSVTDRDEELRETAKLRGLTYESNAFTANQRIIRSGIAVAIPEGHVGILFMRSSVCNFVDRFSNSVGVIDSNYRGELQAVVESDGITSAMVTSFGVIRTLIEAIEQRTDEKGKSALVKIFNILVDMKNAHVDEVEGNTYKVGDRFAQLLIIPLPNLELDVVDTLPESNRNTDGYGSSGR